MDYDTSLNFERFILTFFLLLRKKPNNTGVWKDWKWGWKIWMIGQGLCVMISEKEASEI